jgi:hypothetical protein
MQDELQATSTPVPIRILGVNEAGEEAANDLICQGRDLPWLQDTAAENAWGLWGVTWRDVWILDRHQAVFAIYNLTSNNLADPARYAELKQLMLDAAAVP